MKKLLQLSGILFMFTFLSSCQKSWLCECNQVDSLTGQSEPWNYQINNTTKSQATASCTQYNGVSGSITTTCTLQ